MGVRWYSVVVDCEDLATQARWWGNVLGWPIVYEDADEAVIAPPRELDETRAIPFDEHSPGIVFVGAPETKSVKNRLHIDLAPPADGDQAAEVERLVSLGARLADVGQGDDVSWVVLADPEGNEFCVLSCRD